MKTRLAWLAILALVLVACAPGANNQVHTVAQMGVSAGFWLGLWHGLIAPATFVISLFVPHVGVYEIHNNGAWYNFGFVLGILCHHGGTAAGRKWSR